MDYRNKPHNEQRNHNNWRGLTHTEMQMVVLLADGYTKAESLSIQLEMGVETLKRHFSNIFEKLNVNSKLEVLVLYYKETHDPKPETIPKTNCA